MAGDPVVWACRLIRADDARRCRPYDGESSTGAPILRTTVPLNLKSGPNFVQQAMAEAIGSAPLYDGNFAAILHMTASLPSNTFNVAISAATPNRRKLLILVGKIRLTRIRPEQQNPFYAPLWGLQVVRPLPVMTNTPAEKIFICLECGSTRCGSELQVGVSYSGSNPWSQVASRDVCHDCGTVLPRSLSRRWNYDDVEAARMVWLQEFKDTFPGRLNGA